MLKEYALLEPAGMTQFDSVTVVIFERSKSALRHRACDNTLICRMCICYINVILLAGTAAALFVTSKLFQPGSDMTGSCVRLAAACPSKVQDRFIYALLQA